MPDFPYIYRFRLRNWFGGKDSPLFGRRCRLIARGARNSRLVQFEDLTLHVVSGNALRRAE